MILRILSDYNQANTEKLGTQQRRREWGKRGVIHNGWLCSSHFVFFICPPATSTIHNPVFTSHRRAQSMQQWSRRIYWTPAEQFLDRWSWGSSWQSVCWSWSCWGRRCCERKRPWTACCGATWPCLSGRVSGTWGWRGWCPRRHRPPTACR